MVLTSDPVLVLHERPGDGLVRGAVGAEHGPVVAGQRAPRRLAGARQPQHRGRGVQGCVLVGELLN